MAKKVIAQIKLQCPGGKATAAPPIGPALGQHGVNIMAFVKDFNSRTAAMPGVTIPVVITVYADRSFTFITKVPPAAVLIKQMAKIDKGAADPLRQKVAKLTRTQLGEIAKRKLPDLNAYDLDMAMNIIAGTARSMGVTIVEG